MKVGQMAHVHRFVDRNGHVRHYLRRPGQRNVALPGLPGSPEFVAAYETALATPSPEIGSTKTKPGTVNALIVRYYASTEFGQLAKVTQATYRNRIEILRTALGTKQVGHLRREHVKAIIEARATRPAMANGLLKVLRLLMRLALDEGWRTDDPTHRIKTLKPASAEGFPAWSDEDIAAFEDYHPTGSRPRLALALLLYTGQRCGDVTRMGRQHLRAGRIDVRQQKTGIRLSLPVHRALAAELAEVPPDRLTFLTTQYGVPFSSAGFGQWFSEVARAAEVTPGRSAHGLRKACARRLAEAGCSAHEIGAVTGHRSLREIERYTRAADQVRLADSAFATLGRQARKESAKTESA